MTRSNFALHSLMRNQTIDRGRLWEVSSDLLGILNTDGYFEVTNPAWEASLGWTSVRTGRPWPTDETSLWASRLRRKLISFLPFSAFGALATRPM